MKGKGFVFTISAILVVSFVLLFSQSFLEEHNAREELLLRNAELLKAGFIAHDASFLAHAFLSVEAISAHTGEGPNIRFRLNILAFHSLTLAFRHSTTTPSKKKRSHDGDALAA